MRPKARFTCHAREVILCRNLHIAEEEILHILDNGETLPLGIEPGTSKMHRLFFSVPDDSCFVAVIDERNGDLITIIPPDFDCHCRVSLDVIREFEQKHTKCNLPVVAAPTQTVTSTYSSAKLIVYFRDIHQRILKPRMIILPANEYPMDKTRLEADQRVRTILLDMIRENTSHTLSFEDVWIQFGKKGLPEKFNFTF